MTAVSGLKHPVALLESFSKGAFSRSFRFEGLEKVVIASFPEKVLSAFSEVESSVADGKHAVGFVSYEAANGLNPDLPVIASASDMPLLWFGIFTERVVCEAGEEEHGNDFQISAPEMSIDRESYCHALEVIHEAIAAGETYQVNFTTRQHFNMENDPFQLYRRMCSNQQASFCAWLDIGTHLILSASPELFFSLDDNLITMKPMKGTAPRMPKGDQDLQQRIMLTQSPKERAENLMIVDLVRNDLAKLAEIGSVAVQSLFDVETYPTVHQMTSTVTARVRPEIGLADIFRALFPCGSVTGAPKRRSMEIIDRLETEPRGLYCGAIGYVSPGREAVFSVAIRTAVVEAASGNGMIGIGSGITWDSDPENEFLECLNKSAFMYRDSSPFTLIESLRLDNQGYLLLESHLRRLAKSAKYFGFACDTGILRARLYELGSGLAGANKIRVLLHKDGACTAEAGPIAASNRDTASSSIRVSKTRVNSRDPFLYHKTSRRNLYDSELPAHPECYDILFINERDELTEGSFNTLVILLDGVMLTPSLDSGLLPGVLREELLRVGGISEMVLTLDDLYRAEKIWLINSVRGWRECRLFEQKPGPVLKIFQIDAVA